MVAHQFSSDLSPSKTPRVFLWEFSLHNSPMELSVEQRHGFLQSHFIMDQNWNAQAQLNASGDNLSVVTGYSNASSGNLTTILIFILVTAGSRLLMQGKRRIRLPGPRPLPLVGNAHLLIGDTSRLIYKISDLLDQHDGFMSLWIGSKLHVFVSKPEHLEVFCTSPKLQDKSEHYKFIKPLLGESIFSTNGTTWKQGRKLMMPALRPTLLKNLVPSFNFHTKDMVEAIACEAGNGTFDVFRYIRNCAYAMIYETLYGRQFKNSADEVLDYSEKSMDIIYQRALKLWLQWDPLFYLLPIGRRFKTIVSFLNNFNASQIRFTQELMTHGKYDAMEKNTLVQQLLEKLPGDDQFNELREHIQTMLITGYDTTAGTMGFVLMMLGMHQDVQQKAFEEISRVQADGKDLLADDLQNLEYLERVIKETLRLFPVGPLLFREASDDIAFDDFVVPKGAAVACVMLRTQRDPAIFPDPLQFNPDNFLPEKMANRHPFAYIPFSAGSRGCIGMKYGMMSMKVIISQLVANYKIFCDTKMEDIRLKPEITMKIEGGFKVRIEKRFPHS